MKNSDLPAMPIELNGFGQYAPETYTGLTKREMFAMHFMASLTDVCWDTYSKYEDGKELVRCQAKTAIEMADELLKQLGESK